MLFNNKSQKITLVLSLMLLLAVGSSGCRLLQREQYKAPDISGPPPEAPPIPAWAYKEEYVKKYIKPVGMLPDVMPWAQVFWTKQNHLFVMGDTNLPGKWERYYEYKDYIARKQAGKYDPHDGNENNKSYFPLWDPRTGKSLPVRGFSHQKGRQHTDTIEFSDGSILFSDEAYYKRSPQELKEKGYHPSRSYLRQEIYNPDERTSQLLPPKARPDMGSWPALPPFQYTLSPLQGRKYIYAKYEPLYFKDFADKEARLQLITGELGKNQESIFMDIKTPHRGRLIVTPDKEHLFFVANICVNPDRTKHNYELLKPCNYIDYIDLKKKSFKTIGSFNTPKEALKDPKRKVYDQTFGSYLIAIDKNRLLAFGGRNLYGWTYKPIELFDVRTQKSQVVGQLPEKLLFTLYGPGLEAMVRLSDGSVAMFSDSLYLYNQQNKQFSKVDDLIVPRGDYGVAVSPDDKIYIAGGFTHDGDARLIEMFDYKAYKKAI
jgi:hypothetical protein